MPGYYCIFVENEGQKMKFIKIKYMIIKFINKIDRDIYASGTITLCDLDNILYRDISTMKELNAHLRDRMEAKKEQKAGVA